MSGWLNILHLGIVSAPMATPIQQQPGVTGQQVQSVQS
jgi:hypothetical protein